MKYTLFLLACLFTYSLSAQDQDMAAKGDDAGMHFVEKTFDDLLAQAKAEDKVIFIDAYTTWCGPCKMMAKNVFPAEEVGTVYNERFINAKFDMEKGEGLGLAQRYGVNAYPTYLFVDGNGDIVHKGIGYIPQEEFLALADAASSDDNLGALNKRFDGGERDAAFLEMYAETLTKVYDQKKAGEVMDLYLETLEDWSAPGVLAKIIQSPGEPGGKRMNYLVENADAAMKEAGASTFMMTMQQAIVGKYMEEQGARGLPEVDVILPMYTKYAAPIKDRLAAHYGLLKAQMSRDQDASLAASLKYYSAYPSDDWNELNSLAWTIFEGSEDDATLAKGLAFAKQSVAINENYANLDTLAWLYEKTGDHEMAVKTAKKAIAIAKEEGQDYSETEKILSM